MSRGQKTIAILLTAVAVLVGLDIFAHRAKAQTHIQAIPRAMSVATAGTFGQHTLYRMWSDGTIEKNEYIAGGNCGGFCGWEDVPK
ncbi:MAG: hypothetical protein IH984_15330 [Planctomycetes bacterium]|nr:hypothetical protein [Planctomycetota bacterium]